MVCVCVCVCVSSHKEEGHPAVCNVDGTWAHSAKCNKSDGERQILDDLTYMWNLKIKKSQDKEIIFVVIWLSEARVESGKMDEGFQKVQTCSGKINISWGCNVHHDGCR